MPPAGRRARESAPDARRMRLCEHAAVRGQAGIETVPGSVCPTWTSGWHGQCIDGHGHGHGHEHGHGHGHGHGSPHQLWSES
eukprot:6164838-Prymnesium_polylepis.1